MSDVTLTAELRANVNQFEQNINSAANTVVNGSRRINQSVQNATQSINNLNQPSSRAAFALTNLGRVAQDAPFGFIAIQNNIGPLIDSFGYLRQEAASTGKSLLSLVGGALLGPAGIGLAISAVTAGITYFIQAQQKSAKAAKEQQKAAQEYADTLSAVRNAELKGQQDGEKELIRLNILYTATQNLTLSLKDRNAAYDELEKKYPQYFTDSQRENTLLGKNTLAYDNLKTAILSAAAARAYENRIGEESNKLYEQEQQLSDLVGARIKARQQLELVRNNQSAALKSDPGTSFKARTVEEVQAEAVARAQAKVDQIEGYINRKLEENAKRRQIIQDLVDRASGAELNAGFKQTSEIDDKNTALDKQKTYIQQLQEKLSTLNNEEQQYIANGGVQFEVLQNGSVALRERQRQILLLTQEIERLNNAVSVNKDLKTDELSLPFIPQSSLDALTAKPIQLGKGQKLFIDNTDSKEKTAQQTAAYKDQLEVVQELNSVVGQGLTNAFQMALTGTQSFVSAMAGFLGQLVTRLLAAAAAAAVLAVILNAVGFGSGIGGAASAAGSFKNLFASFSGVKLAEGGVVSKPTIAMIGEGGEPEAVIPLSKLDGMMGGKGGNTTVTPEPMLIGGDLLIKWFDRAQKQKSRTS